MTTILAKNVDIAALAARILAGTAQAADLAAAPLAEVLAIKGDTGAVHYRGSSGVAEKAKADSGRVRRFVASDETPDRMGDIVRARGWRFTEFRKNPVALWGHDSFGLPIGRVIDWTTEEENRGRPALKESIEYLEADANPAADAILRMVDVGVLRAVSVGFLPLKVHIPSEEERRELGMTAHGVVYEQQEQLELSQVTIPANPNALLTKGASQPLALAVEEMVAKGQIPRGLGDELLLRAALEPGRRVYALGGLPDAPADPEEVITGAAAAEAAALESVYNRCAAAEALAESAQKSIGALEARLTSLEAKHASPEEPAVKAVAATAAFAEVFERVARGL